MLGRWLRFGLVYILLGLPIAYMVVTSEDQTPWLVVLAIYVIASGLVGNWYVFFGGRRDAAAYLQYFVLMTFLVEIIGLGYFSISAPNDPLLLAIAAAASIFGIAFLLSLVFGGDRS